MFYIVYDNIMKKMDRRETIPWQSHTNINEGN